VFQPTESPLIRGEMLLEEFLEPLGITQRELADAIGCPIRGSMRSSMAAVG
jgi:plasmid maintenance system antidote protein VapI